MLRTSKALGRWLTTLDSRALGTWCGLLSAAGYTAANVGLRAVAHLDPAWVSAVKSAPTTVLMVPWLLVLWWRRERIFPNRRNTLLLVLGGLVGQLGGNVAFQWSLGIIGLAFAVPLTTGSMILSGAVLGRFVLLEPITRRALVSIGMLIVATCVLSLGAGEADLSADVLPALDTGSPYVWVKIVGGVLAAIVSGVAYSILGVTIRKNVTSRVPTASVLFIVAVVGVAAVGLLGFGRLGWQGISVISSRDYAAMAAAGLCNTAAFICLTIALRETSVMYVNSLSAAQVALAGVLGVMLFQERLSASLVIGVLLTIAGLMCMQARRRRSGTKAATEREPAA